MIEAEIFKNWKNLMGFTELKLVEITFTKEEEAEFLVNFAFLKQKNIPEIAAKLIKYHNQITKLIEIEENDIENLFNQSRHIPLKELLLMRVQQGEISFQSYWKVLQILGNKDNAINFIIK